MMRKINIEVHSEVSNAAWNVGVQLIYNFRVQLGDAKHSCSVEAKRCLTRFGESSTEWETKLEPLKERVRFTFEAARHRTTEDKTPQLKLEDIGAARRKMEAWLGAKQNKFALD